MIATLFYTFLGLLLGNWLAKQANGLGAAAHYNAHQKELRELELKYAKPDYAGNVWVRRDEVGPEKYKEYLKGLHDLHDKYYPKKNDK